MMIRHAQSINHLQSKMPNIQHSGSILCNVTFWSFYFMLLYIECLWVLDCLDLKMSPWALGT